MLKWVFGADTGPYRSALQTMRNETKEFTGSVKSQLAGMFAGAGLIAGANAIIGKFARIKDIADRFGESSESIQRVGAAAEQAGMDAEGVAKGMTKATANAAEASKKGGDLAEVFARMGINAAEFADMSLEDKLLALSGGYDNSESSAQGLADVMKIVGKSGAEMIPLLTQGQEELQDQLSKSRIAGEGVVNVLANLDDRIQEVKQGAGVLFAYIIASFTAITASVGQLVIGLFDLIGDSIGLSISSFQQLGDVIGKTMVGDFAGAKKAAEDYFKGLKGGIHQMVIDVKKAGSAISSTWEDARSGVTDTNKKTGTTDTSGDAEAAKAAAKAKDDAETKRKKLVEEIAKLEEDSRKKSLSLTEQILDAEKRRAELGAGSVFMTDENQRLEAQKGMLEAEKELVDLRKQAATEAEKSDQDKIKMTNDLVAALDEEDKANRDNKFNGLDDKGKVDMLKKERDAAKKDAAELAAIGDPLGATKKRTEAAGKQGDINELTRSMNEKLRSEADKIGKQAPTIAASSLADVGGGGGVNVMMSSTDLMKRQVTILEQIAANTANGGEGGKPPEPNY